MTQAAVYRALVTASRLAVNFDAGYASAYVGSGGWSDDVRRAIGCAFGVVARVTTTRMPYVPLAVEADAWVAEFRAARGEP